MNEFLFAIGCGLTIAAICVAITLRECRRAREAPSADEIVRVED